MLFARSSAYDLSGLGEQGCALYIPDFSTFVLFIECGMIFDWFGTAKPGGVKHSGLPMHRLSPMKPRDLRIAPFPAISRGISQYKL